MKFSLFISKQLLPGNFCRLLCSLFFLPFSVFSQPVINSFSPSQGGAGTIVTIVGSGFNNTAPGNIVFFGAARATVLTASATQLTVSVPSSATFSPISVAVNGLSAYTQQPFIVTFPSLPAFDANSFEPKIDFTAGNYPRNVSIGDIDGDGKSDLASVNNNGGNVSVFRNTSIIGSVSFTPPVFINAGNNAMGEKLFDMDGDGKLDLLVNIYDEFRVAVYRNTSIPGAISFAAPVSVSTNQNPSWIDVGDIDNDGKPDLVSFNQNSNTFSFFKNNSTPGTITMAPKIDFNSTGRPHGGIITDVDGDAKPDIVIANMDINTISVFRNTTTGVNVSFAPAISFTTAGTPFNVTAVDLDGDGKNDLAVPNSASSSISVFKNNSVPGSVLLAPKVDFPTAAAPLYVSAGDLNGDGKPDLAVANFSSSNVSVFKNESTGGTIVLAAAVYYNTGTLCRSVPIGDIDGDARPDIVSSNSLSNNVSVLRNKTAPPVCVSAISLFPYREVFESTDGLWVSSGTASDWVWGTPSKSVITGAGQGNKCWINGGLIGNNYSNTQNSSLQSPCFDFTGLVNPIIQFKLFWDTESAVDGALLEYSTNGGASWSVVGNNNSNANCLGLNWYNSGSISSLVNSSGWSGSTGIAGGQCASGNGSGNWLTAMHNLKFLAGIPSVIFRFRFASNSSCNSYNGFAVDDVEIMEAPPNTADFSFTCTAGKTVNFTNNSVCSNSSLWNFGDASSGAANTSNLTNASHTFSAPGTYTVTLTSGFVTGAPAIITKTVTVLDASITITNPVSCNGATDGVLNVVASGSTQPYQFLWNTNPAQTTSTISNLKAGTYTVTVQSGTACSTTALIDLPEPPRLAASVTTTPEGCLPNTGSAVVLVNGGTAPYTYLWSTGAISPGISNLNQGTYSVTATDDKGCTVTIPNISVSKQLTNVFVSLGNDTVICPGQNLILRPGSFVAYVWQDNSMAPTYSVTQSGVYSVKVTDANGCTGTDDVYVLVDCSDLYFPDAITPNGDGLNDLFGAAGSLFSTVKDYRLLIYNRYGQLVFESSNPAVKWDGSYKNIVEYNQSFIWQATYLYNGKRYNRKGNLLILR